MVELLTSSLFWTVLLVFPSDVFGSLLALLCGSLAGFKINSRADYLLTAIALSLYTCPAFLLAMLFLSLFAFHLGLFPLGNLTSGGKEGIDYLLDVVWHLSLPVAALLCLVVPPSSWLSGIR